jgi:hypothetical protein
MQSFELAPILRAPAVLSLRGGDGSHLRDVCSLRWPPRAGWRSVEGTGTIEGPCQAHFKTDSRTVRQTIPV